MKPKEYNMPTEYPLKGKVCCGNCKKQLRFTEIVGGNILYCAHKRQAGRMSRCCSDNYSEALVNASVAYAIRQYEGYAAGVISREEYIKKYRLLDDDFMAVVYKRFACVELLLRVILNRDDIHIIDVQTQDYKKNLEGRSAILDIFATDSEGKMYDVEIQRSDRGAGFKRARYNGSLMDASVSEPGMKFEKLPDVYMIFITENDVIGKGLPLYHFQPTCLETKEVIDDGKYTIYVNSLIQDETALGKLMYDFWCTDAKDMNYDVLAERVRYFKENEEGIRTIFHIPVIILYSRVLDG